MIKKNNKKITLEKPNLLIVCIQQSKFKLTKNLPTNSFPNYTIVYKNKQGLTISVPKSNITLFTPEFTQSNTHP